MVCPVGLTARQEAQCLPVALLLLRDRVQDRFVTGAAILSAMY